MTASILGGLLFTVMVLFNPQRDIIDVMDMGRVIAAPTTAQRVSRLRQQKITK